MPRIYRVIVPVTDMDRADAFYSEVLGLEPDAVVPSRHYFHCEGVILALVDGREHDRPHRPNPDVVYFAVPDLEASCERARNAGCAEMTLTDVEGGNGIAQRPWGERSYYCLDPDGNPLCFVDDQTLFTGSPPA